MLTEGLRTRTTAEWLAILTEADIPCGKAASLGELMSDSYLRDTGFFQPMQHPSDGEVTVPAFAPDFSATPASVRRLWPTLGEHTRDVLREIGMAEADIDDIAGRGD